MRFDTQLAVAAIPPQSPRYLSGYISELTIHGTVPIPGEKNMMYRARPIRASQPYLLGQPLVYHNLLSPWHASFTVSFDIKQAPGNSLLLDEAQNPQSGDDAFKHFIQSQVPEELDKL